MAENFDLSVLKRHAFRLTYGTIAVGPLESEPKIEIKSSRYDCMIYENGGTAAASYIDAVEAMVEVTTKNVAAALNILKNFRQGDNLLSSANSQSLVFTPIVAAGVTEKTLTFPHAVLLPEASYVPSSAEDHHALLRFRCAANTAGVLFTYV